MFKIVLSFLFDLSMMFVTGKNFRFIYFYIHLIYNFYEYYNQEVHCIYITFIQTLRVDVRGYQFWLCRTSAKMVLNIFQRGVFN